MYEALKGECDDLECVADKVGKDQIAYMLGTLVGLRELGGVISGYDYRGPAGARFFAEAGKLYKQIKQGDADAAFLRALNRTAGILFHYPAAQIDRTVSGMVSLWEGKTGNPGALVAGPPPRK